MNNRAVFCTIYSNYSNIGFPDKEIFASIFTLNRFEILNPNEKIKKFIFCKKSELNSDLEAILKNDNIILVDINDAVLEFNHLINNGEVKPSVGLIYSYLFPLYIDCSAYDSITFLENDLILLDSWSFPKSDEALIHSNKSLNKRGEINNDVKYKVPDKWFLSEKNDKQFEILHTSQNIWSIGTKNAVDFSRNALLLIDKWVDKKIFDFSIPGNFWNSFPSQFSSISILSKYKVIQKEDIRFFSIAVKGKDSWNGSIHRNNIFMDKEINIPKKNFYRLLNTIRVKKSMFGLNQYEEIIELKRIVKVFLKYYKEISLQESDKQNDEYLLYIKKIILSCRKEIIYINLSLLFLKLKIVNFNK